MVPESLLQWIASLSAMSAEVTVEHTRWLVGTVWEWDQGPSP